MSSPELLGIPKPGGSIKPCTVEVKAPGLSEPCEDGIETSETFVSIGLVNCLRSCCGFAHKLLQHIGLKPALTCLGPSEVLK